METRSAGSAQAVGRFGNPRDAAHSEASVRARSWPEWLRGPANLTSDVPIDTRLILHNYAAAQLQGRPHMPRSARLYRHRPRRAGDGCRPWRSRSHPGLYGRESCRSQANFSGPRRQSSPRRVLGAVCTDGGRLLLDRHLRAGRPHGSQHGGRSAGHDQSAEERSSDRGRIVAIAVLLVASLLQARDAPWPAAWLR